MQLHGDFPLEKIPGLRGAVPHPRVIKAVHVIDSMSVEAAARTAHYCDAVLLDTKTAERIGGTGIVHDWSISAEIVRRVDKPVILAGGLNPNNVAAAIAAVAPYAVDVNSGVENSDGSKSRAMVESFIRLAKETGRDASVADRLSARHG